jgi:hypothetical protein
MVVEIKHTHFGEVMTIVRTRSKDMRESWQF